MVQGEINEAAHKECTSYVDAFKDVIKSSEDVRTFVDISNMGMPPAGKEHIKRRVSCNFERFKGNYLIISFVFIAVFLIRQLSALFVLALWAGYFFAADCFGDKFAVGGYELKNEYVMYFCIVLTVLYLIVFNTIIVSLMVTLSLFMVVVVAHMLCYKDEPSLEDV
ncbi:Prenylated rab acceptor 1 [Trachipleistophora hominis]|uniref:PRA1 family protein n=1 Tax=Trachipleistophora hominis TaxID=72359 RepID=L7JQV0_TRAHO|nr:Prenylated rab acceptor 1 [Trachipleistophora hominis]